MRKVIIGGVAVVVIMAFLTLVPVVSGNYRTAGFAVEADQQAAGLGQCATAEVTGSITADIHRPIIDVWGITSVHEVTFGGFNVSTVPNGDCEGSTGSDGELSAMSTQVLFSNFSCADPHVVDDAQLIQEWEQTDDWHVQQRCDGKAFLLESFDHSPEGSNLDWPSRYFDLRGGAAPKRAESWCLDVEMLVGFTVGTATGYGTPVTDSVSACMPLS